MAIHETGNRRHIFRHIEDVATWELCVCRQNMEIHCILDTVHFFHLITTIVTSIGRSYMEDLTF